ncbi:hypothetical protein K2X05_15015 [bacterium]|nr:hypothetical protein [bacterium]
MSNTSETIVLDPCLNWSLTFIRKMSIKKDVFFQLDAKLLPTHPSYNEYRPTSIGVDIKLELIFPNVSNYSLIGLGFNELTDLEFGEDDEAQIRSIIKDGDYYTIEIDLDVIYETLESIRVKSDPPILRYREQLFF